MAAEDLMAVLAKKYKIHDEMKAFHQMCLANKPQTYTELGVEKSRELAEAISVAVSGEVNYKGEEFEIIVPSSHCSEGIPITVYKPASCPKDPAIFIFFHGGGLVLCSRKSHEVMAKIIANNSGAVVINVGFRLLPNAKDIYAPFNDAEDVTKWVLANKTKTGGSDKSKVGVGGDSSGGQLAIGVTNQVPGADFQALIYPMADMSLCQDSVKEFAHIPGMDDETVKFLFDNGVRHMPDYLTNPRINGMKRTNTASSPPALIVLAEIDPFVGCGKEYAEKLKAAGVKVQLEIIKGVPHAFVALRKVFQTTADEALAHVVKFIKQFQ